MKSTKDWEVIIGLEVHTQLNTASKLFSPAANRFGDEPNSNIDPICLGLPGTLPKVNKEAVRKAVILGCALESTICQVSKFDRKSYFYPDAPRNFQITQFFEPILRGGHIMAEIHGKWMRFDIDRAHLEDDAGMLKHFSNFAGVDYNRAGAPLIEIVSKPCMHSPAEAAAYVGALKQLLQHMDVSSCNMEEGALRVDVNVSVRLRGETAFRPKAEIKNMNSISNLEMALEAEIARQIRLYEQNPSTPPEQLLKASTYRWDPDTKQTIVMRTKESADDYRYFPEPDLPPLVIDEDFIHAIESNLPELPSDKRQRYIERLKISASAANLLIESKELCDYFEKALRELSNPEVHAQNVCNWMLIEFAGRFKEVGTDLLKSHIPPENVGNLVHLIEQGIITGKIAKSVADDMVKSPHLSPSAIVEANPTYRPLSDESTLREVIEGIFREFPEALEDYRQGKQKAFGFLVGKTMQATKGQGDPVTVNRLLKEMLS